MKRYEYPEDYAIGEKIVSPARTINEADIVNFAMITGDWYSGHVDKEFAAKTVFGQRFAHGMLTLTLGSACLMWLGPSAYVPTSFIAFVGLDTIRITKPTFIGDTIRAEATVDSVKPISKGRAILTFKCEILNQKNEVLITYSHSVMATQRPQ
jgi:acyl dehydratase